MPSAPIDTSLRRRLEAHLDQLPVLPMALTNLLSLDINDEDYFDDLLLILESEPSFGARLLAAANSAASAPTSPITTLNRAVARVGGRGAADLILAMSVTRVFVPRDPWEKGLWRHGVQVAHAARALARRTNNVDPDEAYVCGLLHDIGRFVLFQEAPDKLRAVDEGDWDTPATLVEQEKAICGLSHAELGAMASERWRLPALVTEVVRRHHDPLSADMADPVDRVVAVVRLADLAMFPSVMLDAESQITQLDDAELTAYLEPRAPKFLSISGPQLREIIVKSEQQADEACRTLGIAG